MTSRQFLTNENIFIRKRSIHVNRSHTVEAGHTNIERFWTRYVSGSIRARNIFVKITYSKVKYSVLSHACENVRLYYHLGHNTIHHMAYISRKVPNLLFHYEDISILTALCLV